VVDCVVDFSAAILVGSFGRISVGVSVVIWLASGTDLVTISQSFGMLFGILFGISVGTSSVVGFALVRNYHKTNFQVVSGSGRSPHNLAESP